MSVWYPKNRGKVRGWTRRARHVEEWRQRHLALDEHALARDGRDYVKLWIDPWFRLVRREPPAWLRRRMVTALVDVHRAWHERLLARERETGEPFDCMLWLLRPFVIDSQVVCATGDMRPFYRDTFPSAREGVPASPPETTYGPSVSDIVWTSVSVPGYTSEEDLAEDPEWARLFERRYRSRVLRTDRVAGITQIQYAVGSGWIGRLPGSTPP
ncbi:MAG: hypothetical protein AAF791_15560 [Bacteroidota bacterium]